MKCFQCGDQAKVKETRATADGSLRRRRVCDGCAAQYITIEAPVNAFMVRKRNGQVERYDQDKLVRSVRRATDDLPVSDTAFDALIGRIERRLISGRFGEPTLSTQIGSVVLDELSQLPAEAEMASVRYALYFFDQDLKRHDEASEFSGWLSARHGDAQRRPDSYGFPPLVVKQNGRAAELFDRPKLARSVELAMRGRRPGASGICDAVEKSLAGQGILTSQQIGSEVARQLRAIDLFAYLRYATIFKRLASLAYFNLEVSVALQSVTFSHDPQPGAHEPTD